MQPDNNHPKVSVNDVSASGFTARPLSDTLVWADGAIAPQQPDALQAAQTLMPAVLQTLSPVADAELAYSSCTDGRLPVQLTNGEPVPVREQLVGADIVSAFFAAEMLGNDFYTGMQESGNAAADRLQFVARFLKDNGWLPSSHVGCGAAGGFVAILRNIVQFNEQPAYRARVQTLLPEGVFDQLLHRQLLARLTTLLDSNAYGSLRDTTFADAARTAAGDRAVAELKDDGRGVHGHMEEAIVRVRVAGKALDVAALAKATGGRQVFGMNDLRMDRLAHLLSRGNEQQYRLALMALEEFADSGHGTLAKGLPTYVVVEA